MMINHVLCRTAVMPCKFILTHTTALSARTNTYEECSTHVKEMTPDTPKLGAAGDICTEDNLSYLTFYSKPCACVLCVVWSASGVG